MFASKFRTQVFFIVPNLLILLLDNLSVLRQSRTGQVVVVGVNNIWKGEKYKSGKDNELSCPTAVSPSPKSWKLSVNFRKEVDTGKVPKSGTPSKRWFPRTQLPIINNYSLKTLTLSFTIKVDSLDIRKIFECVIMDRIEVAIFQIQFCHRRFAQRIKDELFQSL